jgi:CubicO group peptidase (beta-lactamase class C family)
MDANAFANKVRELAEELDVPGVSAGVLIDGEEHYGFAGVTSVENPLPVDENTIFQFGSTGKTLTATAMMRLVEQGKVDLDEPVRTYVPELRLKDEDVAEKVTVLQLFNHTAGWEGDLMEDTGEGDDALERYVARMADIAQVSPLGESVSYNNASLSLAGRVIEKVTGLTFEKAISELLLKPLGLDQTFYFRDEIMSRRFAVGHAIKEGEAPKVARPWGMARGSAPAGGASATARDQLAWARFHLGDGTAPGGARLLSAGLLRRMQEPTAAMPGSALGDAVGISWLLGEKAGVPTVSHGGSMIGQFSSFVMAPSRNFAVISMSNCGPNGSQLNDALVDWAFEHYLGVKEDEPTVERLDDEALAAYTGSYETIAVFADVEPEDGHLKINVRIKPEALASLTEAGQEAPEDQPPIVIGLLEGKPDHYVVTEGPAKGMKGYFSRSAAGDVDAVHVGGRLATRLGAEAAPADAAVLTAP